MTILKQPSGKFRAVLKVGRVYAASRTFTTKRDAQAWLARERAALAGGVDPRAGRTTVRALLPVWLEERAHSVSRKTYVSDKALVRLVPLSLAALSINVVTDREVTRALVALTKDGLERPEVEELLAPARELHGDGMAWSHMAEGLAMFLRKGWSASYRVPLDLPELGAVGPGFVLAPLLPLLTDQNYVVLTLSQKNVRVLRGSRDRIGELDLPSVPTSFDDVFEADGPQSDSVPRPNASGRLGRTGAAVYYGADALDNAHKEDVVEFFREVSRGVEEHLAGRTIPMILAGLPDDEIDIRLARADLRPHTARTLVSADALPAELRRVRRQGYALVDQELEEGLRSVAVPVRDRDGEAVAAVNVPVHASRNSVESVRRDLLPNLLATVARIEADLGITGRAPGASHGSGTHR